MMYHLFKSKLGQPIFLSIEETNSPEWIPEELVFHLWQYDDDPTYTGGVFTIPRPCDLAVEFHHKSDDHTEFTVFQCDHFTDEEYVLSAGIISDQGKILWDKKKCEQDIYGEIAKKIVTACTAPSIPSIPSDYMVWQGPGSVGLLDKRIINPEKRNFYVVDILYPNSFGTSELRILPEETQWWPNGVGYGQLQEPIPECHKDFYQQIQTAVRNLPLYQTNTK